MSNYNYYEKFISSLITRFPNFKKFKDNLPRIKHSYLKKYSFKLEYSFKEIDSTDKSSFFGYYDKSPKIIMAKKLFITEQV